MPKCVPRRWCSTISSSFGRMNCECGTILRYLEIAVEGMEEPQRRISGMIQALLSLPPGTGWGSGRRGHNRAKVRRIQPASMWRPVVRVSPSRLIMVSRPQSVNQWYPAMMVRTSSPAACARAVSPMRPAGVMMNWSAARTSSAAVPICACGWAAASSCRRRRRSAMAASSTGSAEWSSHDLRGGDQRRLLTGL